MITLCFLSHLFISNLLNHSNTTSSIIMKLNTFPQLPDGTRAIASDDGCHLVHNLRLGMRIVVRFYESDKHNQFPRWAYIKRVHIKHRTVARLSLRLDVVCEQIDDNGDSYYVHDIDDFHICNKEHATHWCVYHYAGEDMAVNESAMHADLNRELELVAVFD